MPSLLARFRSRAVSSGPPPPAHPIPPPTTTVTLENDPFIAPDNLPFVPIDRRIRSDLNVLLETYAAESAKNTPVKLSANNKVLQQESNTSPLQPRPSARQNDNHAKTSSSSLRGRPGRPAMSQLPPGGTFGRHASSFLDLAPSNSCDNLPTRKKEKENDASYSVRRFRSSINAKRSARSLDRSSIADDSAFKTPNRSTSVTPHSTLSSKTRSVRISIPNVHPRHLDSPGHSAADYSPPLPLTPLDPSQSQSFTFGKVIRSYSSAPGVQTIFASTTPLSRRSSRRRANTVSSSSSKSSRRSSSEWAANQVSLNAKSWPAEVSREMLRLSLGDQDPGTSRGCHVLRSLDNEAGTFSLPVPASSLLGTSIFLEGGAGSKIALSTLGGDHIAPGAHDKGSMLEPANTTSTANNGLLSATAKGKTPLRSSLRMSSSPALRSDNGSNTSLSRHNTTGAAGGGSKGKRKADEVDLTPSDQKSIHAKFAIPEDKFTKRTSSDPHAPSSYRIKRARIDASTPTPSSSPGRPGSSIHANAGSWSRGSIPNRPLSRQQSLNKPPSTKQQMSRSGSVTSYLAGSDKLGTPQRPRSMSSLSHSSIPLSALVSPHAPSVSRSLGASYHMRDPRKPAKIQRTSWSLRFRTEAEDGSPPHAWFFFLGFVLFPLWWIASVWGIPKTRRVGGEDVEKSVTLDDPQVEHDARSWRFRCRIMSAVSIFTYVPFIVLVAIFAPR